MLIVFYFVIVVCDVQIYLFGYCVYDMFLCVDFQCKVDGIGYFGLDGLFWIVWLCVLGGVVF